MCLLRLSMATFTKYGRWMWRRLFWMAIFTKRSTWINLKASIWKWKRESMQASKFNLWIEASFKELEHLFWWSSQNFCFDQNEDGLCVYKKTNTSVVIFLVLYVDDILMFGNDLGMLTIVKLWLSKIFLMKDMDDASYILGIKIYRDRSRRLIGLSQSLYVDKVLIRFRME